MTVLDVLIVEDGKLERERLSDVLGEAGYAVLAVSSVQAAEQTLDEHSFRLIILDIGLGDRSGSYLFSLIKQRQRESAVIIFTGNPSPHLRQRLIEDGADDFIVKGSRNASSENMLARVRAIIGEPEKNKDIDLCDNVGSGIDLEEFLKKFVSNKGQDLFFDESGSLWPCSKCGSIKYQIIFPIDLLSPPDISGKIVCASCGSEMDPEIS